MEYYCRTQSSFGLKKRFIEKNSNSIEVLFLGSSHTQNAINPKFIDTPNCNLAFGGQPISIDNFLLNKYLCKMSRLNTVFLEISFHSFYNDLNLSDWNSHIYSNLYSINYKVEPFSLKNYSLVYSDYQFFSTIFYDFLNPNNPNYQINEFGFMENMFSDRFEKLNYDSIQIAKTFIMGHEFKNLDNFKLNKSFLEKSINLCQKKGIKVVFLTTPFYKTYFSNIPNNSRDSVLKFVQQLSVKYDIKYYDYSTDCRFGVRDFMNDNHLNSKGAENFTRIINKEILEFN